MRLLNEFQHRFPLCHAPFAEVGMRIGQTQEWVLRALHSACMGGEVSRVGAVFAPGAIGAGALAALRVPPAELERISRLVNRHVEVNHNYEREHAYNLWFVATAPDAPSLAAALAEIEQEADCGRLLVMPLLEEYRIDLGFDLTADFADACTTRTRSQTSHVLSEQEKHLVHALQPGLELLLHPYAALAQRAGLSESACIGAIEQWIDAGIVRRFGIIVRHRELGFRANAMVVWDVPDALASTFGTRLAQCRGVTLAYRRSRCLPDWPYNLFCMVHGRDRAAVLERIEQLRIESGLMHFPGQTLFSRRCYKQRGAHYLKTVEHAHD
jgi:DNA-binding Lrp family transcriptional regulator